MVTDRSGMWVTRSHGGYSYDDEGLSSVLKQTAVITISWFEKKGNQLGDQVIDTFWSSSKRTGSECEMDSADMRRAHGSEFEITVFWNVTPCNVADGYQSFGRTCCFYLQGRERSSTLIMDAAFASETLVPINIASHTRKTIIWI